MVLKRVRASKIGKDIPIIAIASYAMLGDREKLIAAVCTRDIEKRIDRVLVIGQIEQSIGSKIIIK